MSIDHGGGGGAINRSGRQDKQELSEVRNHFIYMVADRWREHIFNSEMQWCRGGGCTKTVSVM